jgi:hypothetical protein
LQPGATLAADDGSHFYLGTSLTWQNNDLNANYTIVETCTNGVDWSHSSDTDVHSGTTTMVVKKVPLAAFQQFRVFCVEGVSAPQVSSAPSSVLGVWGEQAPSNVNILVNSTNQVVISWKDMSSSENGFLIEEATNASFAGTIVTTSVGGSTNQGRMYGTNYGFITDMVYYWRVAATNSLGHMTEWAPTQSAAPASAPGAPATFLVNNGLTGVDVSWNIGAGVADMWYLQVSTGNTNSFGTIHTASGQAAFNWTDTTESQGASCYYRVIGSNAVGVVYSNTRHVIVSEPIAGSTWYIDAAATGVGNGTNWANAWPNFSSIAWGNLGAGARVWIAPGNYDEIVYVNASGSSDAPITFKLATTNAPRGQGICRLNAWVNQTLADTDIHLDGARSDLFPVRVLSDITNNCGMLHGS